MPRPAAVLTAILIAFDVVALATAVARVDRRPSARREIVEAFTVPEYSIPVLDPGGSAHRTMPCFQADDADSAVHAALGAPSSAPCPLTRLETRRPGEPGAMRSYGRW
ncbi:MAG TPA: hypothetical protein VJ650_06845 [Gemmatimonadaceae bacterium]|nr:hypothetical protein [Gemmatimonadaceae bacterium]